MVVFLKEKKNPHFVRIGDFFWYEGLSYVKKNGTVGRWDGKERIEPIWGEPKIILPRMLTFISRETW